MTVIYVIYIYIYNIYIYIYFYILYIYIYIYIYMLYIIYDCYMRGYDGEDNFYSKLATGPETCGLL